MQEISQFRLKSSLAIEGVAAYYLKGLKPLLGDRRGLIDRVKSGDYNESECVGLVSALDHDNLDELEDNMCKQFTDLVSSAEKLNITLAPNASEEMISHLFSIYLLLGEKSMFDYLKELAKTTSLSELNFSLGDMYYYGIGVEKNLELAKKYYSLATNLDKTNYSIATSIANEHFVRGYDYYTGECRDIDYDKAKENYEQSFRLGNLNAGIKLAQMHFNFYHDYDVAKAWCKKVIEQAELDRKYKPVHTDITEAYAYSALGYMALTGICESKSDMTPLECFEKAYKLGDSSVLYNLGVMYECGYGTDIDYCKAMEYYELALKTYDNVQYKNEEHKAIITAAKERVAAAKKDISRYVKVGSNNRK